MANITININRYQRNISIKQIGEKGQIAINNAKVLIVGLGGLGSSAAYYLAAAGVGTIGLMDSDKVELSNLQRQILHDVSDIGKEKIQSAVESLKAFNPELKYNLYNMRLDESNAYEILSQYDAVIEGTDNFESMFLINDICVKNNIPFATAGILSLSGQALFVVPGKSPCLRCVIPEIPETPTTFELGVLGTLPGILGCIEAMDIIRWIVGMWKPLKDDKGPLHNIDGENMRFNTIQISRAKNCKCCSHLWSE